VLAVGGAVFGRHGWKNFGKGKSPQKNKRRKAELHAFLFSY
jgi:hypothetical protein